MRAVVCHRFSSYQDLTLDEVPAPALRPGTVRIDVRAAGISFALSLVVAGRYQRKPPLPFTPGTEAAGIVAEVADDVAGIAPGDRVLASLDWGGLAEQAIAEATAIHKLPDTMIFAEATAMVLSYPTAYAALLWRAKLRPGEVVLVHGAAGAVGTAAVEIAKLKGATVIGTAGGPEKCATVLAHGADHAIDYTARNFRDDVMAITDGRGADLILDPIGGDVMDLSLRAVAREGRIMTLGYASGRIPRIPANILLVKTVDVMGMNYGTYVGWNGPEDRERYAGRVAALHADLAAWYEAGKLAPRVSHRFPLDRYKDAMAAVLERRAHGKVCVLMGDEAN